MYGNPESRSNTARNATGRLRAAWMAQELLTTFTAEIGEMVLIPGSGGIFEIRVNGENVWSRAAMRRFPEMKELKQLVRDQVAPGRDLGHSDQVKTTS